MNPRIPRQRQAFDAAGVIAALVVAVFASTTLLSCAALVAEVAR